MFRVGGTATPTTLSNGYLVDGVSLSSGPVLVGPPTNKDQCKKDGWKTFNNPTFRNQGQCVSFVERHEKDDEDEDEDEDHDNDRNERENGDDHGNNNNDDHHGENRGHGERD